MMQQDRGINILYKYIDDSRLHIEILIGITVTTIDMFDSKPLLSDLSLNW